MLPVLPGAAGVIPASLVNHTTLGYTYDTDPAAPPGIIDLTVGAPATANSIGQPGEVDLYRFTLAAAGRYIIETEGPTDVLMSLFGPNSQTTLVTEDDDSGQDRNARIVSNLSAGAYFVRIRHFETTGTGTYGISVRADAAQPTIPEIQVNGPAVQGNIQAANESDLYRFAATVTGLYTIETAGNTDTFLTLFGPNSETAQIAQDDDSGPETNSRINADLAAGIYFARVRHYSPTGTGAYSISVRR
jgi:tyrosinase